MFKDKLLEAIPEFELIEDQDLKEKTIRIWEKAMIKGGWKIDDLYRMPFTLLLESCPCSMIEHVRGVTNVAINAAKALKLVYKDKLRINMNVLISGALLHDIGKLIEYKEEKGKFSQSKLGTLVRHPISGVGLCYCEDVPGEILHIIASHSWEGGRSKRSPEAVIVHHADFTNFEQFK